MRHILRGDRVQCVDSSGTRGDVGFVRRIRWDENHGGMVAQVDFDESGDCSVDLMDLDLLEDNQ
jgi:hypothetical protein